MFDSAGFSVHPDVCPPLYVPHMHLFLLDVSPVSVFFIFFCSVTLYSEWQKMNRYPSSPLFSFSVQFLGHFAFIFADFFPFLLFPS